MLVKNRLKAFAGLALGLLALTACQAPEPAATAQPERVLLRGKPLPLLRADASERKLASWTQEAFRRLEPEDEVTILVDLGSRLDWQALTAAWKAEGLSRPALAPRVAEALDAFAEQLLANARHVLDDMKEPGPAQSTLKALPSLARVQLRVTRFDAGLIADRDDIRLVEYVAFRPFPTEEPVPPEPRVRPAHIPPGTPWAAAGVGAPEAWDAGLDGRGMTIALLDGGWWPEHVALADRFLSDRLLDRTRRGGTHGNSVISSALGRTPEGVALGPAPAASWIAVDPLANEGYDPARFEACSRWLLREAPDVVVVAFILNAGQDNGISHAFSAWRAADLFVCAAAGNLGPLPSSNRAPANLTGIHPGPAPVFAVGASALDKTPYVRSSRGPNVVDGSLFPIVSAPGDWLLGATEPPLSYGPISGTSFAVGVAAGVVAVLRQAFPDASVTQLERALTSTATDAGKAGPDMDFGHGILNIPEALKALAADADSPSGPPATTQTPTDSQDSNERH